MRLRAYTLHAGGGQPPQVLREGFAWLAFATGPLWLLWHRLWIGLLAYLVPAAALLALAPPGVRGLSLLGLHLLVGFEGRDLLRARLARQGRALAGVVIAPNAEAALWRALRHQGGLRDAARQTAAQELVPQGARGSAA